MSTVTTPWIIDAARRAADGHCVHVRVPQHDLALSAGRIVPREEALERALRDFGFAHVLFYDPIRGAWSRRPAPAELEPLLTRVLGTAPAAPGPADAALDPEVEAMRRATDDLAGAATPAGRAAAEDPRAMLDQVRELLVRAPVPLAIVIDDAELTFHDHGHDEVRPLLGVLRRCIEARRETRGRRNAVVLLQTGTTARALDDLDHGDLHRVEACGLDVAERAAGWAATIAALPAGRRPSHEVLERLAQISDVSLVQMRAVFRDAELRGLRDPDATRLMRSYHRVPQPASWDAVNPLTFAAELRAQAGRELVGQDHVIDRVVDRMITGMQGVRRSGATRQPLAVFVFTGPPGTGKTVLARTIARVGLGDESRLVRFDMNHFQDEASIRRLIGSERGYVDSNKGGELVNALLANPSSVILLDEFDKAPPAIAKVLLQVIEEGRISDGQGRVADAGEAIIVLATNFGVDDAPLHAPVAEVIRHYERALELHFEGDGTTDAAVGRPFVSRMRMVAETLGFAPLRPEAIADIARHACAVVVRNFADIGIDVRVDADEAARIVERRMAGTDELEKYGARSVIPFVDRLVNAPVARCRAEHFGQRGLTVDVVFEQDGTARATATGAADDRPGAKAFA